ncbi:MAG: MotA/TolQ/ExbB proton channel family protein [Leucothrix sp.]
MTEETVSRSQPTAVAVARQYPVEQAFFQPLLLGAILVLVPALLVHLLLDAQSMHRLMKILFGNWISPLILWFFVTSLMHLWMKRGRLVKEQRQTELVAKRVLPSVLSERVASAEGGGIWLDLQQKLSGSPASNDNLLLTRLKLFLAQSQPAADVDEAFGITEREYMRGSFALSRFMVWAIPILGFIGTVWGISNGIAHFSDAMTATSSVTDVSSMLKDNLPLVTNSLATAFDTTLLALLLSVPLMMTMIWLEKREEAYLIQLDQQWFHEIKPRLHYEVGGSVVGAALVSADGTNMAPVQSVANEIKMLGTQIAALQETMEDLYEMIFESRLSDYKKHGQ